MPVGWVVSLAVVGLDGAGGSHRGGGHRNDASGRSRLWTVGMLARLWAEIFLLALPCTSIGFS